MIPIKTQSMIELMRRGGKILADAHRLIEDNIKEGVTTARLDQLARKYIEDAGAKPSFLGMYGFPASACISIDNEVIHGIPSGTRRLTEGMIVSVDLGVYYGGFHTDAARSHGVGRMPEEKQRLIDATRQSFFEGINGLKAGSYSGGIGERIERYVRQFNYGIVREYCGHGVGADLHEDPNIPNYAGSRGARLSAGTALAIEPMINMGKDAIWLSDDGWTVFTGDGLPSAHYENTVIITETGVEIITL